MLERLPDGHEEDAELRAEHRGIGLGHAEEGGVEIECTIEHAATWDIIRVATFRNWHSRLGKFFRGKRLDGLAAARDEIPVGINIRRAGEAASHANHRDRGICRLCWC